MKKKTKKKILLSAQAKSYNNKYTIQPSYENFETREKVKYIKAIGLAKQPRVFAQKKKIYISRVKCFSL